MSAENSECDAEDQCKPKCKAGQNLVVPPAAKQDRANVNDIKSFDEIDPSKAEETARKLFGHSSKYLLPEQTERGKTHQRSKSLREVGEKPPPSPTRRKSVRFADALGLELADVKVISNAERELPPEIPAQVLQSLRRSHEELTEATKQFIEKHRYLTPLFNQPGSAREFLGKVFTQAVCLETAVVSDMTILGTIRVRNLHFEKKVGVRWTYNDWKLCFDTPAEYVHGSSDGTTDKFSFTITAPNNMEVGGKVDLCVRFEIPGNTFWDNNQGQNYVFECFSQGYSTLSTSPEDSFWRFT
ncbi:Protein phosphatase 1 regulatory subunit 3E [Branchiostoma belcheri]|nr:Protein phosphatase 1 regulatory subunit 3E [Branchiostoma belcheri]